MISTSDLVSAMKRRGLDNERFARGIGVSPSTVSRWLNKGIPKKYKEPQIKELLDQAEVVVYGGRHIDMFPETTKGLL